MRNKNIVKYLTSVFDEMGNKEHEGQFQEAMEALSKMNFTIKRMGFGELVDQSTWLAMNSCECMVDIEDVDDDELLYETCWRNLLYWQTDLDLFYDEVCSENPELEWLDEFLAAYLNERICSAYPYLKDSKTFNRYYKKHAKELPYLTDSQKNELGLMLDDDEVVQILTKSYELKKQDLQGLESIDFEKLDEHFGQIIEIVYDADFRIPKIKFDDILQRALQNYCLSYANKESLKVKSFSMLDLYNLCLQHALISVAGSEYFSENITVKYPEFVWMEDVVRNCLRQKLVSVYPYLKDENAFIDYVESGENFNCENGEEYEDYEE